VCSSDLTSQASTAKPISRATRFIDRPTAY
jgi:hypothetical protein